MSHSTPKYGPSAWNSVPNDVEQPLQTLTTRPWSSTKRIWEEDDHALGTLPHRSQGMSLQEPLDRDIANHQSWPWHAPGPLSHLVENPQTVPSDYPSNQALRASAEAVRQHPLQRREYQFRASESNNPQGYRPFCGLPRGESVLSKPDVARPQRASSTSAKRPLSEQFRLRSASDLDDLDQFGFDPSKSGTDVNFGRAYMQEYSHDKPINAQQTFSRHHIGNHSQPNERVLPVQALSRPRDGRNPPVSSSRYAQYRQNGQIEAMWKPQSTENSLLTSGADSHLLHEMSLLGLNTKLAPSDHARSQLYNQANGLWRGSQLNRDDDVRHDGHAAINGLSKHKKNRNSTGLDVDHTTKWTSGWNVNRPYNRRPPTPPSSSEQMKRTPRVMPDNAMDLASLQYGSHTAPPGSAFQFFNDHPYHLEIPSTTSVQDVQQDSKGPSVSRNFTGKAAGDPRHSRGTGMDGDSWSRPPLRLAPHPSILVPNEPGGTSRSGVRSRLLEDFKGGHKSGKSYELRDIYNHIVEFSGDQEGSRFIQTKMDSANSEEKARIFGEILPNALPLMLDVFGNYIIQKFFEIGEQKQKRLLVSKMRGQMVVLSLHIYGCRAVQKALQFILVEEQACLVRELEQNVTRCVKDQNGNHVMQAALEHVPPQHMPFVINTFLGQIKQFSLHVYGCRVVQRLLRYWSEPERSQALEEVHACAKQLISDQYGNYVIQHVLGCEQDKDRQRVIDVVRGDLVNYSKQKFASNVVEKCLSFGDEALREEVMKRLCQRDVRGHMPLTTMIKDAYGNYVIQKLLETLNDLNCNYFLERLAPEVAAIKRLPGASKPVEMVAKKMQDRMARPLPLLLPTPPRTAEGSRSSSAMEEGIISGHRRAEDGEVGGEGKRNPTLLPLHPLQTCLPRS